MNNCNYKYLNYDEIPKGFFKFINFNNFSTNNKKRAFAVSRYALFECIKDIYPNVNNKNFNELIKINNHFNLTENPDIKVSVSHKNDWGIALISSEKNIKSVGVDIELNKSLSDRSRKFFMANDKSVNSYSLIETWSVKESAYKAISSFYTFFNNKDLYKIIGRENFLLNDIWINNQGEFGLHSLGKPLGDFIITKNNNLIISKAFKRDII
jgi:phosphopantetheinyl transferase (holo-ACP synthase)